MNFINVEHRKCSLFIALHAFYLLSSLKFTVDDPFKTFNWLNKYKACKAMNESHFYFFLLYVADLHNLKIEKKLRVMCRPKVRGVEMANMARQEALAGVEVGF